MRITTRLAVLVLALGLGLPAAHAAQIRIINQDDAGEGLNDDSPREPVGGNEGTTLGEQRMIALEYAAEILGSRLRSAVTIQLAVDFDRQSCSASNAMLASSGAETLIENFPGAPRNNTFYTIAQANALAGERLDSGPDIGTTFNSTLDEGGLSEVCLGGADWYYGLDNDPPEGDLNFVSTAVHEILHGLGFATFVDLSSGAFVQDTPDIYSVFIRDLTARENWHEMSDSERMASAQNDGNVVWSGYAVTAAAPAALSEGTTPDGEGTPRVLLYAPSPVERGSSISHWDTSLRPDALMEPFNTPENDVLHGIGLSACLLRDIGWDLINGTECPDESASAVGGPAELAEGGGSDSGGGGGGGCTLGGGTGDPLWPLMLLLALAGIAWRPARAR